MSTLSQRSAAYLHAFIADRISMLSDHRRGQGTVEYVGIVVTMALLLGAVAVASKGWGNDIGNSLKTVVKQSMDATAGRLSTK